MLPKRYAKLSELPNTLPVFPLRNVILLPRTVLPLNIYEPRYLHMVDDVLAGNRLIGIVQPSAGISDPEEDENESPQDRNWPLRPVGCMGRLTAYSEQDDGRVFITLSGIARFRIEGESDVSQPYRICEVSAAPYESDLDNESGGDTIDRGKLLTLLRAYLEANDLTADWESINDTSTEFLVNALCIHSPFGPEEKQALLEAESIDRRADLLMALAEMEMASGSSEGGGTLQ